MKWWRVIVLGAMAVAGGTGWAQAPNLAHMDLILKAVPDGPVAKVNGESITADEFRSLYKSELARREAMSGGKPLTDEMRLDLGIRCLGMIVENEILYQEALKHGLKVSDADVLKGWQNEVELMQKQIAANSGKTPSEDELLKLAGTSRKEALEQVKKAQLSEQMRAEVAKEKKISVTDKEVEDFFKVNKGKASRTDQCHLKQIFIRVQQGRAPGGLPRDKAKERAEDALHRIRAGQSFEAVAKLISDDPEKDKGGDIGLRPLQSLPPFLVDAAGKLKPDEVSGIIESEYGFHLIKLVEMVPGVEPTLEKTGPQIRRILLAEKTDRAVKEYCAEYMKDSNAVDIFMDLSKTIALHQKSKVKGAG